MSLLKLLQDYLWQCSNTHIPYNSNIYANKCIGWLPTVTSSVSVFVCNCLTDVSFMDFVRKHGNAPWTPPWKGDVITSSLHPHILKWVSKFTSHGLLRIYRKKHTSSVALPLMIPHGNLLFQQVNKIEQDCWVEQLLELGFRPRITVMLNLHKNKTENYYWEL